MSKCCLQEVEPTSSSSKSVRLVQHENTATTSKSSDCSMMKVKAASSLATLPRQDSPTMKKLVQHQGHGDLIITPVIPEKETRPETPVNVKPKIEPSKLWSRIGHPTIEDFVLMAENTFTVENSYIEKKRTSRLVASGQIEFHPNNLATNTPEQDMDIMVALRRKREILPHMWDVYEKISVPPGKENSQLQNGSHLTYLRRRYVVAKGAFPCSLCNRCFRINQGFDREDTDWQDSCEGNDNSTDLATNKSSDYDEVGESNLTKDMKLFSCHICAKVFPRRSSLKRHQRTHMDRKLFSCPLCQKGFNRKEHLSRHMISHSGGRPYNCDICDKPFTRKEHLSRHRLGHLNDALNFSLVENTGTSLVPIQNNNNNNDIIPVLNKSEESSPEVTGNSWSLIPKQEDETSPNVARPYVCDLCGQGFARKEHLLRHQLRTHRTTPDIRDELKPYECSVCHKNFTRKEHLVRHQKIHTREFLLGSPRGIIPGTDVSVSPVLTNRGISSGGTVMRTEPLEGVIPHPSLPGLTISTVLMKPERETLWTNEQKDMLGNNFANGQEDEMSASSVYDSMEIVEPSTSGEAEVANASSIDGGNCSGISSGDGNSETSKPHKCQYCPDKTFTRRSHLVRHFKRFHSDKPLSLVSSGKPRVTAQEKQEFERFMLNDGQYWCTICGKTFGRRYHLVRHMKLHGPNEVARPFHCSACNNSFSRHEYFQSHKCGVNSDGNSLPFSEKDNIVVDDEPKESTIVEKEEVKEVVKKIPAKRDKRKRSKCNYECVTCGKGFSKKKLLNRHSESHADLLEDNSQHFYDYN
ncbi:hypothetical protein C0J52_09546 [Blattella germanica]|nr:hypothetical protein C0J52_09546 [Blattella germanica]